MTVSSYDRLPEKSSKIKIYVKFATTSLRELGPKTLNSSSKHTEMAGNLATFKSIIK